MSKRLKVFLVRKGISSSRTTPYHPQGNAQCERYNGIIWKAVKLRSRKLHVEKWEVVIPEALNSIRSLLYAQTKAVACLNGYANQDQYFYGNLCVLENNYDVVRKVQLVDANPMYAKIRYPDGQESNVSLQDVARCPNADESENNDTDKIPQPWKENVVNDEQNGEGEMEIVRSQQIEREKEVPIPDCIEDEEPHSSVNDTPDHNAIPSSTFHNSSSHDYESTPRVASRRSGRSNRGVPAARLGEWIK